MLFGLSVPSLLLIAIAVAVVWIYVPFLVVAYARAQIGYLTNKEMMAAPRATFDQLPDYGKRATWAHQNALEAFPIFAAAALMAYVTHQTSAWAGWAAIAWIVARFLYPVFYILNLSILRSLMFGIGSVCSFTLIGLSLISTL
ncbi:MAPEG family protein [Leptolyngbya sp. GGD]|uniref:MAPEG family protein n=1 Tax=Leptolyngbya sp. GGD TaxID=2997907 RepID=UPI00227C415F|nr:MAPEG family protein [Leptolyngbya sp. GGD]MCY6488573.1 MAPEG family protein [Leptolyngbya sp. GGD]